MNGAEQRIAELMARVAELERRFAEQDATAEAEARRERREEHRRWRMEHRGRHPLDFDYGDERVLRWTAEVDRAVSTRRAA